MLKALQVEEKYIGQKLDLCKKKKKKKSIGEDINDGKIYFIFRILS